MTFSHILFGIVSIFKNPSGVSHPQDDALVFVYLSVYHSEATAVPEEHPDTYGAPAVCLRLKQKSIFKDPSVIAFAQDDEFV